ncbi:MAG: hypothetical protein ACE5R6_18815 [Candidatus Heimdallarchaeota archaeon]
MVAPSTGTAPEVMSFQAKHTKTWNYAIIALFSALAVATSLLLVLVPNLETITLVIFLVSLRYGFRTGMFTAMTIAVIFELIASQLFGSGAIIFPFKLIAYLLIALTGALWKKSSCKPGKIALAITGATLAILFDMITTLGLVLWLGQPISAYFVLLVIGIVVPPFFTPLHVLGNAFLFQLVSSIQDRLDILEEHQVQPPVEVKPDEKGVKW